MCVAIFYLSRLIGFVVRIHSRRGIGLVTDCALLSGVNPFVRISPVVHPKISSSLALWVSGATTVHFWRVGQRHLGFEHLASNAKTRPVAILLLV